VREDRVRQTGYAAWVEHSLQWKDWLRSVVGARADFYRAEVASDLAVNSGSTRDRQVSPKLNLIFGPFRDTEYFVGRGHGFRGNDESQPAGEAAPVSDRHFHPVEPRSLRLTLTANF